MINGNRHCAFRSRVWFPLKEWWVRWSSGEHPSHKKMLLHNCSKYRHVRSSDFPRGFVTSLGGCKQSKVPGILRMCKLSFLQSIFKTKARKSQWWPDFNIRSNSSPAPLFPEGWKGKRGGGCREKAIPRLVYPGPTCSLFLSTYSEYWKHRFAKLMAGERG